MAIDCRLVAGFDRVRQRLLQAEFTECLDRPLAYWSLPSDRRLPLPLIDRSLHELLSTPFDHLRETPGVGPKKLATLVALLDRVAQSGASAGAAEALGAPDGCANGHGATVPSAEERRDVAAQVSEALWSRWQIAIERHGLGHEWLGRFAPSLQDLPRPLWCQPLAAYAQRSLAEIRALKAHGEKRVGTVLAIFGNLYGILTRAETCPHLTARIMPAFVAKIESWLARRRQAAAESRSCDGKAAWSAADLREAWVTPLVEQVAIDAGEHVVRLVESRLYPSSLSVQQTARRFGLTRGRVYETLADVEAMLAVRWPEGRAVAAELLERATDDEARALVESARRIFFPARQEAATTIPFAGRAVQAGGWPGSNGKAANRTQVDARDSKDK